MTPAICKLAMVLQNLNLILPTCITADWWSMLCSMNPSEFEKLKSSKCTGLHILNMQCQRLSWTPILPSNHWTSPSRTSRSLKGHLSPPCPRVKCPFNGANHRLVGVISLALSWEYMKFGIDLQRQFLGWKRRKSIRGDFWACLVKILVFPIWTGYMLTSFGFSLLS